MKFNGSIIQSRHFMTGASENGGIINGASWELYIVYSLFYQCSSAERSVGWVWGNPPGDCGEN